MPDPRTSIINERLKQADRIIAISSGKGGVGKSLIATTLALALAKKGHKVGLFDLDFTSPSTHLILGIGNIQPKEEKGIVPPETHGISCMSIIYYTQNKTTPLRGEDTSNALIELLTITKWPKLDYLILDMPPGIGDATLDLIRLIKQVQFLIVTTPSKLAFETIRKLAHLLKQLNAPIVGVIENMKTSRRSTVQQKTRELGLAYMGEIPYDTKIEDTIGSTTRLENTMFAKELSKIAEKL
jgi:ATP-binding protein involved in chromosome partitioning